MARLIIHPGTGTIIDLDDGCWFIDTNALPDDVDIEDLASTDYQDLPEDIPASNSPGFQYTVADLDEDIDCGILTGDHVEWLKAQPAHEREFVIRNAYQVLFEDSDYWTLWQESIRYSAFLAKRASETSTEGEPF